MGQGDPGRQHQNTLKPIGNLPNAVGTQGGNVKSLCEQIAG